MPESSNGWGEYKLLVVQTLDHLTGQIVELDKKVTQMDKDICKEIAILKTKAGIYGAVAAFAISTLITIGSKFIK